jgi:hypothetical protein
MSSLIFPSSILNLDFHLILSYTKSDSEALASTVMNTVKIFNQLKDKFMISDLFKV